MYGAKCLLYKSGILNAVDFETPQVLLIIPYLSENMYSYYKLKAEERTSVLEFPVWGADLHETIVIKP